MKQIFYSLFFCERRVVPGDGFDSCRTRMLFEYEWKFGLIKMLIVNALAKSQSAKSNFSLDTLFQLIFFIRIA